MATQFLDASVLTDIEDEEVIKFHIQQDCIRFEFPNGTEQLPLIEECRAMNCLDLTNPDNFDFMFDITVQSLVGKPVFVYFIGDDGSKNEISHFVITDRYMNLRSVEIIDEYPILVNWLVEFFAGKLSKKYPRSLKDIQARMSVREERMKLSLKEKKENPVQITMS